MRTKRLKRRSAAILALAGAGALAVAGIAMGAGNSTATANFTPVNLANPGFTNGKIFVHTHTNYTNPGNQNPGGATERAQLYFDDDFRVNTNATTSKCNPNSISSATTTLAQAQAACSAALVGTGTAQAVYDPPPPGGATNTVNGCVRIYNGQGTTSEILVFTRVQVGLPGNNTINCSTNGSQGNVTVLLPGDLKAAGNVPGSGDADYQDPDNCSPPVRLGCQLDFPNITDHAAFPLSDFNSPGSEGQLHLRQVQGHRRADGEQVGPADEVHLQRQHRADHERRCGLHLARLDSQALQSRRMRREGRPEAAPLGVPGADASAASFGGRRILGLPG